MNASNKTCECRYSDENSGGGERQRLRSRSPEKWLKSRRVSDHAPVNHLSRTRGVGQRSAPLLLFRGHSLRPAALHSDTLRDGQTGPAIRPRPDNAWNIRQACLRVGAKGVRPITSCAIRRFLQTSAAPSRDVPPDRPWSGLLPPRQAEPARSDHFFCDRIAASKGRRPRKSAVHPCVDPILF